MCIRDSNTSYLRELAHYGITAADVAAAGCYAYELATWRLARHIAHDRGDLWQRAANYHSRTPSLNSKYRAKVMACAIRWANWLKTRYTTREFAQPVVAQQRPPIAAAGTRKGSAPVVTLRRTKRPRVAQQAPAASAVGKGWVQNGDIHLSPDELRALQAGP